jgi:hypothetical protein
MRFLLPDTDGNGEKQIITFHYEGLGGGTTVYSHRLLYYKLLMYPDKMRQAEVFTLPAVCW